MLCKNIVIACNCFGFFKRDKQNIAINIRENDDNPINEVMYDADMAEMTASSCKKNYTNDKTFDFKLREPLIASPRKK